MATFDSISSFKQRIANDQVQSYLHSSASSMKSVEQVATRAFADSFNLVEKRVVLSNLRSIKVVQESIYKQSSFIGKIVYFIRWFFGAVSVTKTGELYRRLHSEVLSETGVEEGKTENENPYSQHLVVSRGGTFAFSHESTVDDAYYAKTYGERLSGKQRTDLCLPDGIGTVCGMNMDRGGAKILQGGTTIAVVCDGVSKGGVASMHFAQGAATVALEVLERNPTLFAKSDPQDGIELFAKVVDELKVRPGPVREMSSGATTCAALRSCPIEGGKHRVEGAALGDSSVFHINSQTREIKQLNQVQRKAGSKSDTGGQLTFEGLDRGKNTSSFSIIIEDTDMILMVTDGLTDNFNGGEKVEELLPLILFNPLFDQPVQTPWVQTVFPDKAELTQLKTQDSVPTPAQAAVRCTNYVAWVTAERKKLEQIGHEKEQELKDLPPKEWPPEKKREIDELAEVLKGDRAPCGKTDDVTVLAFIPA